MEEPKKKQDTRGGAGSEAETPRWDVWITPSADEWQRGFYWGNPRSAGRVRLTVQTVLLSAVLLWSLSPLLFGGKPDVFLAAVAAAVCAAMWLVPPLKRKADARAMASSGHTFRLRVYEEGLVFGEEEHAATLPFDKIRAVKEESVLVLFYREEVLVVPRRALPDEGWRFLVETLPDREKET